MQTELEQPPVYAAEPEPEPQQVPAEDSEEAAETESSVDEPPDAPQVWRAGSLCVAEVGVPHAHAAAAHQALMCRGTRCWTLQAAKGGLPSQVPARRACNPHTLSLLLCCRRRCVAWQVADLLEYAAQGSRRSRLWLVKVLGQITADKAVADAVADRQGIQRSCWKEFVPAWGLTRLVYRGEGGAQEGQVASGVTPWQGHGLNAARTVQ